MKMNMEQEIKKLEGKQLQLRGKHLTSELVRVEPVEGKDKTLGYGLLYKTVEGAKKVVQKDVPSLSNPEKPNDNADLGVVPLNAFGAKEDEWYLTDDTSVIAVSDIFNLRVSDGYTERLFRTIPLVIGFATEWVVVDAASMDDITVSVYENTLLHVKAKAEADDLVKDKFFIRNDWNESSIQAKRRVLSYQFSCVMFDDIHNHFCHYDYIVLCAVDAPLSYARLINGFLSLLKVEMPQFKKQLRQYKSFENPDNLSISSKAYMKAKDNHERSYPYNKIALVSHFNGVDLTNFYNNKKMMDQLSCMNKLCFFNGRALNSDNYHDKLRGIRTATLVRDTMLLSSNNSSLQSLGENIGIEKLDCSDYVDHMDKLLHDDIGRYVECGLSDSVISLLWTLTFNDNNLNQKDIYATVGSAAAHRIRESIKAKNRWTTDKKKKKKYLSIFEAGNYYQGRNQKISDKRSLIEQDAINSFFGGRNECFSHGIFTAEPGKEFLDIDLRSAYPIAMCICFNMNWDNPIVCSYNRDNTDNGILQSEMFQFNDLGFGLVDFEFPKELTYPCIPVKSTTFNGLVFPRKGSTYANISEIKLALDMGASVTVSEGGRVVVLSTKDENDMFDAVKEFIKTRKLYEKKYGKKSGQALLQKLYANSAFGKR